MKSILIFVDWFEPGYLGGGPIRSISGFVDVFKNDFKLYLITRDKDLNCKNSYSNINSDTWMKLHNNVKIMYLSKTLKLSEFRSLIQENTFDWVYLNSFFSIKYSFLPYFYLRLLKVNNIKILIAPRGEFNPERLNIKSKKKNFFLKVVKFFNFYKDVHWHATALEEKYNINKVFPSTKYLLSANLSKSSIYTFKNIKKINSLKVVFISRIVDYKNLHYAIDLIIKMKNKNNLVFDIYGPIEDRNYFNLCMNKANSSKADINYKGELKHNLVKEKLSEYDVFLFPTLGENYGHVIAESLMSGCIVITSDQTPWNDLEISNAGWSFSLSEDSLFVDKLNSLYNLSEEQFMKKKEAVYLYAKTKINTSKSIKSYYSYLKL